MLRENVNSLPVEEAAGNGEDCKRLTRNCNLDPAARGQGPFQMRACRSV